MHHPTTTRPPTLYWAWAILAATSGTSLAFNIRHAITPTPGAGQQLPVPFGVAYGIMPVLVALALSHMISTRGGHPARWVIGGGVFLAALGLSVRSIAAVLAPSAGAPSAYAFAIMLDVASLMALYEVVTVRAAASVPVRGDVERGGTVRNDPEPLPVRPHEPVREPVPALTAQVTSPVGPADRDRFVAQLAQEIRAAGPTWRPDYTGLQARTGRGRSWCEKAVRAARTRAHTPVRAPAPAYG